MAHKFHIHVPAGQIFWFCAIICLLSLSAFPSAAWSETSEQEEEPILRLNDGTVIELTEDAVIRKQPAVADSIEETILWSISAKEPQLPLLFEKREGVALLLYFVQEREHYGEFHAVRIEDGREQWVHPAWISHVVDIPVSPIFVKPWIYFGRTGWLERMDPDDGKIVERYPARVNIQSLRALPNDEIEIHAETDIAGKISLRFRKRQFSPHLAAYQNLLFSVQFSKRAEFVMEGFDGTFNPSKSIGYLDLHMIKKEPPPPMFVLRWRDFDLQETEQIYRKAYQGDSANPYFPLYLALAIYHQNRRTEAEPYFQDALKKSKRFWEESLRLGVLCESQGLPQWADSFYEQGLAQYFQDVQAPPRYIHLIEILIAFLGGANQSSALFSHGNVDRALHVFEIRRQLFPYTEIDNWFSRKYAHWLRQMGQEDKAMSEEQRIGQLALFNDPVRITPTSLIGFMMAGFLVFGAITLKNEARARHEIPIVLITMVMIGAVVLLPDSRLLLEFGKEFDVSRLFFLYTTLKAALLIVMVVGYIGVLTFFRRRRSQTPILRWQAMFHILTSSYIVLLTGLFIVYISGQWIFKSPIGGKIAETVFLLAFIGLRYRMRRSSIRTLPFKNFKLFVCIWLVLWCQLAWVHHQLIGTIREQARLLIPSIDLSHPDWRAVVDKRVEEAEFRNRDLMFMQAVVHQLGGDFEFASQIYQQYPNDPRSVNNLGIMLLDNDRNKAKSYFEQALDFDPEFAPTLYNLGILNGDRTKIEQAEILAPWRVKAYRRYAADKPWIAVPSIIREWPKATYWSRGGFPLRGFTEILFDVTLTYYVTLSLDLRALL